MSTVDQSAPLSRPFVPSSHKGGTLHHFRPALTAFEHTSPHGQGSTPPQNTLIFINGLYGTPLSVSYTTSLLQHLPPGWILVEPLLSSFGTGFGTSSLTRDVKELASLASYLRKIRPGGKLVLLGHSTGCQDAPHYLCSEGREARAPVDGVILQAPVSDREGLVASADRAHLERVNAKAREWVDAGRAEDVLPSSDTKDAYPKAPVTARRWLSLLSPGPEHDGEDDYFSSDLGMGRWRKTFGRGGKGLKWLVLHMGNDQFVPASIDKVALVDEWKKAVVEGGGDWDDWSGVLPGGDHGLEKCGDEVRADFGNRVGVFLGKIPL